jgi:hypothetical protein
MRLATLAATVLALTLAAPATAQLVVEEARPPKPKPDCLDGSKYDDGKFENGLRPIGFNDNYVMLIEAPSYPAKLEKLCIAWRRTSFWTRIWFDVRIWAADGPDGGPGTLIDTIPALFANNVPTKAKFYTYDVRHFGIVIDGPVYIGPYWDPLDYFLIYLAMDTTPKTPRRRGFTNVGILDDHPPNRELGMDAQSVPSYRAFGIRAKFGPP